MGGYWATHGESWVLLQEHLLGASPCPGAACGGSQVALGFGGEGEKGNGKGDQEVAKPLAVIPLFNPVKDRICSVIPVGKDLWRSLVPPPPINFEAESGCAEPQPGDI